MNVIVPIPEQFQNALEDPELQRRAISMARKVILGTVLYEGKEPTLVGIAKENQNYAKGQGMTPTLAKQLLDEED